MNYYDPSNNDISGARIYAIEEHCRKIHADAVVQSFVIAFSVPARFLHKLFQRRPGVAVETEQIV